MVGDAQFQIAKGQVLREDIRDGQVCSDVSPFALMSFRLARTFTFGRAFFAWRRFALVVEFFTFVMTFGFVRAFALGRAFFAWMRLALVRFTFVTAFFFPMEGF